jgi:SAM-dependent methyltransferase
VSTSFQRAEDVEVEEALRFLLPFLGGARRVLDVGCGNGLLSRRLLGRGFDVTALDRSLRRTERTEGLRLLEADFLGFEDAPYDALVFSASLHHLFPLEAALARADGLLRPGGLLLVSDFDLEAPDEATARFYYDMEGLLLAAGLYRPEKVGRPETRDALRRWHEEHEDTPPFHTGTAMHEAVARRFELLGRGQGPYLYRYVVSGLVPSPHGPSIAAWALATEKQHLADGVLKPVGLLLWARKAEGR